MSEVKVTIEAQAWVLAAYGKVEDLRLEPIASPDPIGSQILIEVEAVSLNPLDLKLISGVMAQAMPVSFPFVPGSDVCGRILSVGPEAAGFEVGDRVVALTSGAMATRVLCDARGAVVRAPHNVPAANLASLPEAGMTALAIMREADLRPGSTIAVIGATGGIGLLLCQLAKQAGAQVIATAAHDDEVLVRTNGASDTIDYEHKNAVEVLRERYPDGVDVLVDLINQFDGLLPSVRAVRRSGRLISTLMGPDPSAFDGDDVEVRYVRLAPSSADLKRLVDDAGNGIVSPLITRRFAFSQVPQAFIALRDEHARGKLVVERG